MGALDWVALAHDLKKPEFDMKEAINELNRAQKIQLCQLMKSTLES